MKRILLATITMFLAMMVTNVQAANVSFNPGSVELTVESGKSAVANLVVKADSKMPFMIDLKVGTVSTKGNMPSNWLRPANASLVARRGGTSSSNMNLVVSVPTDTPGGTYTAMLPAQILRTTEPVVKNDVAIIINVPNQKKCDGAPLLKNVEIGPEDIWAPKSKEIEIGVSGTVVAAPGCDVTGTYTMESNEGMKTGPLPINPDGSFAVTIKGKFSKKGGDKDGTVYNGELSLLDAEGSRSTKSFFVTVSHDRGK